MSEHQSWRELILAASRDRDQGALAIARQAAVGFAGAEGAPKGDLQEALYGLCAGQRSMAPVLNLATLLAAALGDSGPEGLRQRAAAYVAEIDRSLSQFERHLIADPPPGKERWGFFSASSTVIRGIKVLQNHELPWGEATVGISDPGGEGSQTLEAITGPKEIVPDSTLFEMASRGWLDRVIIGCDACDGRSFINKIGTGPLVSLARQAGARIELWTTSQKLVSPETLPLLNTYTNDYDDVFDYSGWLLFGLGSLSEVSVIRCDQGALTPSQVAEFCADLPVPPDDLKAVVLGMDASGGGEK